MPDSTLTYHADAVVIGAGFAGLSAAVRLAHAGKTVVVLEEAPRLGGRASAFTDRDSGERVDNGQHVLFGCYRETYAFLERIGTASLAPLQARLAITVADCDGRSFELACPNLPPPWHLVAGVLRWKALPLRDRLSAARMGWFIQQARRKGPIVAASEVPADQTVAGWLGAHGQTPKLRTWLWDPLAIAALNQSAHTAAAAPFARVVAELFGPREQDAAIGLARAPLDELYAKPAAAFVEARRGAVHLKSSARVVLDEGGRVAEVRTAALAIATRTVISSVPWHAFGRIWSGAVPSSLAPIAIAASRMRNSPIVTVNFWFDEARMPAPFIGLINGPMHWVFDKSAIFGESAGHLSVVASGADALAAMDNGAIVAEALAHLRACVPALAQARLRKSVVVREQRATFALDPGGPPRPGTLTPLEGFYLAGDWTDTGLPATIEGAVLSGHRAADAVLGRG